MKQTQQLDTLKIAIFSGHQLNIPERSLVTDKKITSTDHLVWLNVKKQMIIYETILSMSEGRVRYATVTLSSVKILMESRGIT